MVKAKPVPPSIVKVICETLRDAGKPLTRVELTRRIEGTSDTALISSDLLMRMVQEGLVERDIGSSETATAIVRFKIAPGVDCSNLR